MAINTQNLSVFHYFTIICTLKLYNLSCVYLSYLYGRNANTIYTHNKITDTILTSVACHW